MSCVGIAVFLRSKWRILRLVGSSTWSRLLMTSLSVSWVWEISEPQPLAPFAQLVIRFLVGAVVGERSMAFRCTVAKTGYDMSWATREWLLVCCRGPRQRGTCSTM